MQFVGWMMDIARDQSPHEDWLVEVCERSRAAGYNSLGLYLEHRYAYPSAPWAAAEGALTPEVAKRLVWRFKEGGLRIIPFLNTLGHMEGFIRSQGGEWLAEGSLGWSLQMCPSRPECVAFARELVEDAMAAFDDEWVHLGGDETRLLGDCPVCAERVKEVGKAGLYAVYYAALCRWVLNRGRRPCLWGDMLLHHPEAITHLPRETLIFDWQYFNRPRESTAKFRAAGFDVVCCPSVQSYNAGWCFLDATQRNIDEHAADAAELGALGVLVTTWEFTYFSSYASVMPLIYSAGRRLTHGGSWETTLPEVGGSAYATVAAILGNAIPATSAAIAPGTWRLIRDRFVIRQNPFELWRAWHGDACGPPGDAILRFCDKAAELLFEEHAPPAIHQALRLPIALHRAAVQFVRLVQTACDRYRQGSLADCVTALESAKGTFDTLTPLLQEVAKAGGSQTDLQRLRCLREHVRRVIAHVEALPAGQTWRPAFETIVSDRYIARDQANWQTGDLPPYKPD